MQGKSDQSQILLGLRGVGKTVLLNKIEAIAEEHGYLTSLLEAPEDRPLPALLYPMIQQTLRKLSLSETAKAAAYFGMRALRSFARTFKVEVGDFPLQSIPNRAWPIAAIWNSICPNSSSGRRSREGSRSRLGSADR